ncbi:MAG TPA: hypothetical protein VH601_23030 [Bryobacteraceae bacterium]|jgi:hypothetical protein
MPASTPLTLAAGWVALGFIALLGIAVLWYIFTERIDLTFLISEPNGDASMSRFQLLIFTFVIAASLFLIIASPSPPRFPDQIPQGVLILLGISSSSYLVSKGIQFSRDEGVIGGTPEVKILPATAQTTAGGHPIQFKADVLRLPDTAVTWHVRSGGGSIDANGHYTPPESAAGGPPPPGTVVIEAVSQADPTVSDLATITLV